jgi:hypothetical protein
MLRALPRVHRVVRQQFRPTGYGVERDNLDALSVAHKLAVRGLTGAFNAVHVRDQTPPFAVQVHLFAVKVCEPHKTGPSGSLALCKLRRGDPFADKLAESRERGELVS